MLESQLRPALHRWILDRLTALLVQVPQITPLRVTFVAAVLGTLVPVLLWAGKPGWAISALVGAGFLDIVDGSLARARQQANAKGACLDIVADRWVECCAVLGLAIYYPEQQLNCLIMLIAMMLCVTSFLLAGIFTPKIHEKSFYYSPGLMERAEAFIFFVVMICWSHGFTLMAYLFCVLVMYTAVRRLYELCAQLDSCSS